MPRIVREADATWDGTLARGSGTLTATSSGTFVDLPITLASRLEVQQGKTSPEELLAAAHAACYCMGLAHELDGAGHVAGRLEATAVVSFVPGEGVKSSRLAVRGRVLGIDEAGFQQAAEAAAEGCPISGALKGNVEISVEATLES